MFAVAGTCRLRIGHLAVAKHRYIVGHALVLKLAIFARIERDLVIAPADAQRLNLASFDTGVVGDHHGRAIALGIAYFDAQWIVGEVRIGQAQKEQPDRIVHLELVAGRVWELI